MENKPPLRNTHARPEWDEYFMEMVHVVKNRSTCIRRAVGAVIVKDKQVLATGYNGQPRGAAHAAEVGCLRERLGVPSGERHELCRGLHAEQNAIIQAAYHGVAIAGAEVYCTTKPCIICTKMLINAGIKRVIYEEFYDDPLADELAAECGLEMVEYRPKGAGDGHAAAKENPGVPAFRPGLTHAGDSGTKT